MFTKYELETITIKILDDNPSKWFSQSELFDYLKRIYSAQESKDSNIIDNFDSSKSELFIGHYLFVWEKLLINTNFIEKCIVDFNDFIKIKNNILPEIKLETIKLIKLNINLNEQIIHMIDNFFIYNGSSLIKKFLININKTKYSNIYDIILDYNSGLSNELVCKFIDNYGDHLNIKSDIIQYILKQPLEYNKIKVNEYILNYLIEPKSKNISNITKKYSYTFTNFIFYGLGTCVLFGSISYYRMYIK